MLAPRPVSYDMSHYFGMLRRHWWIIALLTAIGIAGALGLARTQSKVYDATTDVLVMPTSSASANVSGGRTTGTINLDTEAQIVTSADVASDAAKLLKVATSPDTLASHVSVDVPANTSVMAITYAASTPAMAQAGANAFANAYLANRQASAQADLTNQINAINATIRRQQAALTKVNDSLGTLKPDSAKYANAQSQRQTLTSQINSLTNKMSSVATTTVAAGKVITGASLPTKPTKPSIPMFLASGAMLGILLGIGLAILRQRADRRVRFAGDITRRAGLPLLATLPARVRLRFDDVYPPYGAGGRTFNRLRNEILASLQDNEKIIVVTGASKGNASTLVSTNLASALARAGSEVVLMCAHQPGTLAGAATMTRMLSVSATPGLSDVLAGKVPLETVTQRAPGNPWLRIVAAGGTASASGFLQSQTLREILSQLRAQADYIVIEAPSTANSADAQSLASFADAAIVVVELRRTTHSEVRDAADQLKSVSTSLVGGVVLPKLKRSDIKKAIGSPDDQVLDTSPTEGVSIESVPTAPIRSTRDAAPSGSTYQVSGESQASGDGYATRQDVLASIRAATGDSAPAGDGIPSATDLAAANVTATDFTDPAGYGVARYEPAGYDPVGSKVAGYESVGYESVGYGSVGYGSGGYESAGYESAGYEPAWYQAASYEPAGSDASGTDTSGTDARDFGAVGFQAAGMDAARAEAARVEMARVEMARAEADRVNAARARTARDATAENGSADSETAFPETDFRAGSGRFVAGDGDADNSVPFVRRRMQPTRRGTPSHPAQTPVASGSTRNAPRPAGPSSSDATLLFEMPKRADPTSPGTGGATARPAARSRGGLFPTKQAPNQSRSTGQTETPRTETARTETARTETALTEIGRSGATPTETARSGATRAGAAGLDAARLDAARIEAAQVEAAQAEATQIEAGEPEFPEITDEARAARSTGAANSAPPAGAGHADSETVIFDRIDAASAALATGDGDGVGQ